MKFLSLFYCFFTTVRFKTDFFYAFCVSVAVSHSCLLTNLSTV